MLHNGHRVNRTFTMLLGIASILSLLLVVIITETPAHAQGCVQVDWDPHSCSSGAINNGSVDIWGQQTSQGNDAVSGGGTGSSGAGSSIASGGTGPGGSSTQNELTFRETCMQNEYFAAAVVECWDLITQWVQEQTPTADGQSTPPAITLADLASFSPRRVSLSLQPGSWTVVGVETNFIAGATAHIVTGSLLGRAAEVRFTPSSYDWSYGDGSSRTTDNPGASWSTLGVKEFARTNTSHRYLTPAKYTPSLTVWYSVEYRWGGGSWQFIPGRIPATASASTVTVFTADTVLVTGVCTAWRIAPGC